MKSIKMNKTKWIFVISIIFVCFILGLIYFLFEVPKDYSVPKDRRDIFAQLLDGKFANTLTLAESYNIILPYVKKWSDDAVLIDYRSNIIDKKISFTSSIFTFESIKNKKTLLILYNFKYPSFSMSDKVDKSPLDSKLKGDFPYIDSRELNNHFIVKEIKSPYAVLGTDYKDLITKHSFIPTKYLSEDVVIKTAQESGLSASKNEVYNQIELGNLVGGDKQWIIKRGEFRDGKMIRIDATSGKIIYCDFCKK